MAKSNGGIEVGSFQTSGADDDLEQEEPKQRGGDGSAVMNAPKQLNPNHPHNYAHKRPMTG